MESVIRICFMMIFKIFPFKDIFYWLKLSLCRLCIRVYRRFKENRLDFYDINAVGEPERAGILSHRNEINMEKPQSDAYLTKAEDKLFLYGVNSKSESLVISISRLCNQKAEANIHMKLSNGSTYRLMQTEDFQQSLGEKNAFSCGGLQMYFLNPLRQWRIFFSGYLRENSEENPSDEKMVYVKFSLLWKAASDVYDATADINDENIAKAMAQSEWKSLMPPLVKFQDSMNFYVQSGAIAGTVFIQDTLQDYELYLFGQRIRSLEDTSLSKKREFCYVLGYVHENGTYVCLGETSVENIVKKLKFGFVVQPTSVMKKASSVDIPLLDALDKQDIKGKIDDSYAFCGCDTDSAFSVNSRGKDLTVTKITFHLNGKRGTGVKIRGIFSPADRRNLLNATEVSESMSLPDALFPMVVPFTEDMCQLPEVTGGKGSSLGKLTKLSKDVTDFQVPQGIVVTTAAYKSFLTTEITKEIRNLESILYGNSDGDLKQASERVKEKVTRENFPNNVLDNIVKNMKKTFGDRYLLNKYAVRSSATGEDTEQMSAAGQMDTFLGVSGLNNILIAVKKCWASQFGPIAVQYKKRYGQILNSAMAVVIQEMVPCQVAGVIFTCDPLTGNPTTVTITANFGLGESVVSGSEEPDTIELARDYADNIKLSKVTVGAKGRKIVLKGAGTHVEEVSEEEKKRCCLSEEDALKLGRLSIQIEKHYRSRRDIEWGMKDGKVYIFQSRPVTSGSQETDYEIEHEMDPALRIENEHFSVSHAAEAMPGAMSTLGMDVMFKCFMLPWQKERQIELQNGIPTRYFRSVWLTMSNHLMFVVADVVRCKNKKEVDKNSQATMIAFFGRVIDEEEIFDISAERYKDCVTVHTSAWKGMYGLLKNLLLSRRRLNSSWKKMKNYRIPEEKYSNLKDLFNAIVRGYHDIEESTVCHFVSSGLSMMWNMNIMSALSQSKKTVDVEVYSNFSNLIVTSSEVESADVPTALQNLSISIGESITPSEFKAMKPEDALNWLTTTSTLAGKKFKEFLSRHGHRCIKEADMYSIPWGTDPLPLVKLLQNMVGNTKKDKSNKDNSILKIWSSINKLKVPLGFFDKLKLLIMVPLSRKSVQERELSKSLMCKNLNAWRTAYWSLARRMVSEGRIPDEKIFFFMTLDEIKELLDTRSPKILSKAYHRQRLFPKLDKYMYPEIMKGLPKPLQEEDFTNLLTEDGFSMSGIPVSQGVTKGFVRVAVNVEEAASLKPGEILIAYSTDIGWSPFFPILAGVATELGGSISHGAVVSREYGLPCVAGVHGATRRFKTGDYVLLDGNRGILQKIPAPTDS